MKIAMSSKRESPRLKPWECQSSQTRPFADLVDKAHAIKGNRVHRSLYQDGGHTWNATV